MFSGASTAAQRFDEINRLKQEIEELREKGRTGHGNFQEVPVEDIVPLRLPDGMGQPRKYFDPTKMAQLKDSIAKHDVLEPVLLRPAEDGKMETVSGERRWRCCRELGKPRILARIKTLTDEQALEVALIATIHSEGVSTIEETDSVLALIKLYLGIKDDYSNKKIKALLEGVKNYRQMGYGDITEEQAELVETTLASFGFNLGSFVSNRLPLLDMSAPILEAVRTGALSPTNALLINRKPQALHGELIAYGKSATKKELQAKIAELQQAQAAQEDTNNNAGIIEQPPAQDWIYNRIKAIRKKRRLIKDERVQQHLKEAQKSIAAIDEIARELGVGL